MVGASLPNRIPPISRVQQDQRVFDAGAREDRQLGGWCIRHTSEFKGFGAEPLLVDYGEKAVGQDALNGSVGRRSSSLLIFSGQPARVARRDQ